MNEIANNIDVLISLERKITSQLDNLISECARGNHIDDDYLNQVKRSITNTIDSDFRFLQ